MNSVAQNAMKSVLCSWFNYSMKNIYSKLTQVKGTIENKNTIILVC